MTMSSLTVRFPAAIVFFSFLLLLQACTDALESEQILARVNSNEITKDEFRKRAEFYPPPRFVSCNGFKGKRGLLEYLIGEKLMAQAAHEMALDTSRAFKKQIEFVELRAVLQELFELEVKKKIEVDSTELLDAFDKQQKKFDIQLFRTSRESVASSIRQELLAGITVGVGSADFSGESKAAESFETVSWGDLPEPVEKELYAMQIGDISNVIRSANGYVVLRVQNVWINPITPEGRFKQNASGIRKVLRARKMRNLNADLVANLMNKQSVIVKGDAFEALARWLDRITEYKNDSDLPEALDSEQEINFDRIAVGLKEKLNEPLVTFHDGHFPMRAVLEKFHFYHVRVDDSSPAAMRRQLHADLKRIVQDALLAREGYNRGLQSAPAVQSEVRLWRDYYSSQLFAAKLGIKQSESGQKVFPEDLLQIREEASIKVDNELLDSIQLTRVPVLAMRPGTAYGPVVPPWPVF